MAVVRIKVTPDVLRSKANEIQNEIRMIKREWDHISQVVGSEKSYWEGDASTVNTNMHKDIQKSIEKVLTSIAEQPGNLLKIAGVYDSVETNIIDESYSLPEDVII